MCADEKNAIRSLRRQLGLSQTELAERIGMLPQNLSAIEKGHRKLTNITLGQAKRIARALGCSIDDLI